jgi:hypothetical protein
MAIQDGGHMTQIWHCPHTPPSTNHLFPTYGKRRVKSNEYKAWIEAAGWSLAAAKLKKHIFPVILLLTFGNLPAASDVSNRIKAVEDLLVTHGILPGDSIKHVHSVTACISSEPFEGFEVEISHSKNPRDLVIHDWRAIKPVKAAA